MRPLRFLGDSLKCLRDFPEDARHDAGYQLDKVQRGRVIYLASLAEAVYVLHAFHKKTAATPRKDLEIAKGRFKHLLGGRI